MMRNRLYWRRRRWARRAWARPGMWRRRGPGCFGCGFVLLMMFLMLLLLRVLR